MARDLETELRLGAESRNHQGRIRQLEEALRETGVIAKRPHGTIESMQATLDEIARKCEEALKLPVVKSN